MSYTISLKSNVRKDLKKFAKPVAAKLLEKIAALADCPRPNESKKLKGFKHIYRARMGDYRVIYEINDNEISVIVIKIGHRQSVYQTILKNSALTVRK